MTTIVERVPVLVPTSYCIRLKISAADREDAWDLYRVAQACGGVEVHDCRFEFATEEQWLTALEAFQFQFGPEYFEAIESAETCDERGDQRG